MIGDRTTDLQAAANAKIPYLYIYGDSHCDMQTVQRFTDLESFGIHKQNLK